MRALLLNCLFNSFIHIQTEKSSGSLFFASISDVLQSLHPVYDFMYWKKYKIEHNFLWLLQYRNVKHWNCLLFSVLYCIFMLRITMRFFFHLLKNETSKSRSQMEYLYMNVVYTFKPFCYASLENLFHNFMSTILKANMLQFNLFNWQ